MTVSAATRRGAVGVLTLFGAATAATVLAGSSSAAPGVDPSALAGAGAVLRVESLTRVEGAVRLVATFANHTDGSILTRSMAKDLRAPQGCISIDLVDPATGKVGHPAGTSNGDCSASTLPSLLGPGKQVTFAVDIADPGGTVLDVVNVQGGVVRAVPVSGAPAPSSTDVGTYQPRSASFNARAKQNGARVTKGKKVSIDLDTDVLFAVDSAKLSARANKTLDTAAEALRKQAGRRVGVYGHTDSTGTSAQNRSLSLARATAVQKALASRLGAGWTYEVKGYGETKPLVPEVDQNGRPDAAARALNRRVELAVS